MSKLWSAQVNERPHESLHAEVPPGRSPISSASSALRKSSAHRLEHPIDERVVIENFVDPTELALHQFARVRRAKENCIPKCTLTVASTKHPYF